VIRSSGIPLMLICRITPIAPMGSLAQASLKSASGKFDHVCSGRKTLHSYKAANQPER